MAFDTSQILGAANTLISQSPTLSNIKNNITALGNAARSARDLFGGIKQPNQPARVNSIDAAGRSLPKDTRVRIKVPSSYFKLTTQGGVGSNLSYLNGIIFPYTPQITFEHKAEYAPLTPTHSNYALNFYKSSSISAINISGKFSVQNDADADVYLATVHLLRALTKMKFGADEDRGAPPPVCQLMAYGDYMLDNVPVAIASFKNDLPDAVDYYGIDSVIYGKALVPTVSTISINCIPMYSRKEMLASSVSGWLSGTNGRKAGYL